MFKVVPFEPEHLEQIEIQAAQRKFSDYVQKHKEYGKILKEAGPAFTGITNEGIVGISGVAMRNPKCAEAWAVLGVLFPKYSIHATRAILKFIKDKPEITRIQIAVNIEFEQGHRWAKILGFQPEGIMKKFDEYGNDHVLYAKINEGLL